MAKKESKFSVNNTEETKKSKINKEEVNAFESEMLSFLSKETGVDIRKANQKDFAEFYISSGNYALNWALSHKMIDGGFPGGKIITFEGKSGYGKSLLTTRIALEHVSKNDKNISFILDIENAINPDFVLKIAGNDEALAKKVNVVKNIFTIEDLTQFLNKIITFKKTKKDNSKITIIVDSWSILSSKHEKEIIEKEKDAKDMSKAVAARTLLRAVSSSLEELGITLILVMHVTQNIGVMFGEKEVPASHGNAALFMASLRLQLYSSQEIKDKKERPIGFTLNLKTKKNRIVYKNKTAGINMYFAGETPGINKYSGLVELGREWDLWEVSTKEVGARTTITWTKMDGEIVEFKALELEKYAKEYGEDKFIEEINKQLNMLADGKEATIDPIALAEDETDDSSAEIYNEEA